MTGVQDEAPPWWGGLVHGAEGLDEEGKGAVGGDHLDDALPGPGGELGAEGNFGGLVAFPAGVVGAPRGAEGETRLGHAEPSLDDGGGRGVKRAEASVPSVRRAENGHDVSSGSLE